MNPRNPQSFNRYAYVMGDPVNRNDASGLDCDLTNNGLTIGDLSNCQSGYGWGNPCPSGMLPGDGGSGPCAPDNGPVVWGPGPGSPPSNSGDGGDGGPADTPPPPPSCEDELTDIIGDFLSAKMPVLATYAFEMVMVGQLDDIDPRLFAAIAIGENGSARNNPFGTGPNGSAAYGSLMSGIEATGSILDKYIYGWDEDSVSKLYSGNAWQVNPKKKWITTQPPAYCVGTTPAQVKGCQATGRTISSAMEAMGGSPDWLYWPCFD